MIFFIISFILYFLKIKNKSKNNNGRKKKNDDVSISANKIPKKYILIFLNISLS